MDDQKMLQIIYQNAEMGLEGIDHLMPHVQDDKLWEALLSQQAEYRKTCLRSDALLLDHG